MLDVRAAGEAGVVDEEVEAAELVDGRLDERGDGVLVGHVRRDDVGVGVVLVGEGSGDVVEALLAAGGEDDLCALAGEGVDGRATDTGARTGDDSRLAVDGSWHG